VALRAAADSRWATKGTFVLICALSCGWTAIWAGGALYLFLCSRLPVPDYGYAGATFPGGPAWWGPGWLSLTIIFVGVVALPLATIALFGVTPVGFWHLRRAAHRMRWMGIWAAVTAAGLALEVASVLDLGGPDITHYVGRVVPDWSRLTEACGFLALGALMIGIALMASLSHPSGDPAR
jgi:hypothetical protein